MVSANGGALVNDLRVHKYGSGPTEIHCVHGFGGSGQDFSLLQHPKLHLKCVDLPGHGDSPLWANPDVHSLVDWMAEWLPADAILLGYSLGGRLALQAALRAQLSLRGLILVGASPGIRDQNERVARKLWDVSKARALHEKQGEFWSEWEQMPLLQSQAQIQRDHLEQMRVRRRATPVAGPALLMERFGSGSMPSVWDCLGELSIPTLLLVGELDPKYRAVAQEMSTLLPSSSVIEVPDAGHCAHLERPQRALQALIDWIDLL